MNQAASIRFVKSVVNISQIPQPRLPEIAVIGRSNVGKSTFINTLFNRKNIALVSSVPGKTRQINFFLVADRFYLVDLPGYGYKKLSAMETRHWPALIESYLIKNKYLKQIFLLIDCRHDPQDIDLQMIAWLQVYALPFSIVLTKRDKLSNNQFTNQINLFREAFSPVPMIPFSSKTRTGRSEILGQMEHIAGLQRKS